MNKLRLLCFFALVCPSLSSAEWRINESGSLGILMLNSNAVSRVQAVRVSAHGDLIVASVVVRRDELVTPLRDFLAENAIRVETPHEQFLTLQFTSEELDDVERARDLLDLVHRFEPVEPEDLRDEFRTRFQEVVDEASPRNCLERVYRNWKGPTRIDFSWNPQYLVEDLRLAQAFSTYRPQVSLLKPGQYERVHTLPEKWTDDSCAICRTSLGEALEKKENGCLVQVNCPGQHVFCQGCVEESYQHLPLCPICKGKIAPNP